MHSNLLHLFLLSILALLALAAPPEIAQKKELQNIAISAQFVDRVKRTPQCGCQKDYGQDADRHESNEELKDDDLYLALQYAKNDPREQQSLKKRSAECSCKRTEQKLKTQQNDIDENKERTKRSEEANEGEDNAAKTVQKEQDQAEIVNSTSSNESKSSEESVALADKKIDIAKDKSSEENESAENSISSEENTAFADKTAPNLKASSFAEEQNSDEATKTSVRRKRDTNKTNSSEEKETAAKSNSSEEVTTTPGKTADASKKSSAETHNSSEESKTLEHRKREAIKTSTSEEKDSAEKSNSSEESNTAVAHKTETKNVKSSEENDSAEVNEKTNKTKEPVESAIVKNERKKRQIDSLIVVPLEKTQFITDNDSTADQKIALSVEDVKVNTSREKDFYAANDFQTGAIDTKDNDAVDRLLEDYAQGCEVMEENSEEANEITYEEDDKNSAKVVEGESKVKADVPQIAEIILNDESVEKAANEAPLITEIDI